jgi:hypothetical protein
MRDERELAPTSLMPPEVGVFTHSNHTIIGKNMQLAKAFRLGFREKHG